MRHADWHDPGGGSGGLTGEMRSSLPGLGDCNPRRTQSSQFGSGLGFVCIHKLWCAELGDWGISYVRLFFGVYRGTVARTPGMQHSKSAFDGSPCAYTGDLDVYIPLGLQCRLCGIYFPQFSLCSMGGLAYAGLHHWWHPLGPLMEWLLQVRKKGSKSTNKCLSDSLTN